MIEAIAYRLIDSTIRLIVLAFALALMVFIVAAGANTALAASLRAETILTGDNLTVGDIFDNAGRNASYVLGPAPQPGKDMVLNSRTLLRIAMALDLPWQPSSTADQIVVRRAATRIDRTMILDAVSTELRGKVTEKDFKLDVANPDLNMDLPHDAAATLEVTNVSYNPRTSRFEATVSSPSVANPLKQVNISGSVRAMALVPVLKTSLRNGDIIGQNDLDYVEMFASDLTTDTLIRDQDLIGTTPRRAVASGKPLRSIDVQSPQLVGRGETVRIVFKEGSLNLSATGKALQNGSRGDVIKVVNTNSNRPIDAIVSASREVIVSQ